MPDPNSMPAVAQQQQEYYLKGLRSTFRVLVEDHHDRDGSLFYTTIKVGGRFDACVSITVSYDACGTPYKAKIPLINAEPECGLFDALEKNGGTPTMIKMALQFVSQTFPPLKVFEFDDMSQIDCHKEQQTGEPIRKLIYPLPLHVFYITFNGKTWYESHFGARMKDTVRYNKYRQAVKFMHSVQKKAALPWDTFRRTYFLVSEVADLLEPLYKASRTFAEFFESIPREHRCVAVNVWLEEFIREGLQGTFDNRGWIIDVDRMTHVPITVSSGSGITGGRRLRRTVRGRKRRSGAIIYNVFDDGLIRHMGGFDLTALTLA